MAARDGKGQRTKKAAASRTTRRPRKAEAVREPTAGGGNGRTARGVYARSQADLAWVFGVTVQAVQKWIENGAPAKGAQGYSLRDYVRWRAREQRGSDEDAALERRLKTAKVTLEEARAERECGKLVSAEDAEQKRLAILRWFLGHFDRAGPELASKLAGRKPGEIKRITTNYFERIRRDAAGSDGG